MQWPAPRPPNTHRGAEMMSRDTTHLSPSGLHSGVASRTVYVSGKPVAAAKPAGNVVRAALQSCNNTKRTDAVGARARAGLKETVRLECPHCKTPSLVRTSQMLSVLTKESTHACTNPECGHTFVALTEIVRTLSPSATPDPSVNLPLSSHVRRDLLRATLDYASSAAHTTRFTQPVTSDLFPLGTPPPE